MEEADVGTAVRDLRGGEWLRAASPGIFLKGMNLQGDWEERQD